MSPGRSSFLGGLLGAALSRPLLTAGRALGKALLGATVVAVLLFARWFLGLPEPVRWLLALAGLVAVGLTVEWRMRARRPVWDAPPPPELTFLYRWYHPDGTLLYVGITNDLARRCGEHADDKPWMQPGVRATVESYPSREAALVAEEHAIYREGPRWNVVHNGRRGIA